jgi:hypothetical protein
MHRRQFKVFQRWQDRSKLWVKHVKVLHALWLKQCLQADLLEFLILDLVEGGLHVHGVSILLLALLSLHLRLDLLGSRAGEWILLRLPELIGLDELDETLEESTVVRRVKARWWEHHVLCVAIVLLPDHPDTANAIVSVVTIGFVGLWHVNHFRLNFAFLMSRAIFLTD